MRSGRGEVANCGTARTRRSVQRGGHSEAPSHLQQAAGGPGIHLCTAAGGQDVPGGAPSVNGSTGTPGWASSSPRCPGWVRSGTRGSGTARDHGSHECSQPHEQAAGNSVAGAGSLQATLFITLSSSLLSAGWQLVLLLAEQYILYIFLPPLFLGYFWPPCCGCFQRAGSLLRVPRGRGGMYGEGFPDEVGEAGTCSISCVPRSWGAGGAAFS